jgi:hypothetical protein
MAKLSTPHLRVVLSDPDAGPEQGIEHIVWATNPDLVAFDRERPRHNWPMAQHGPVLWMTFIAWRAMMRAGKIQPMTMEQFEVIALSISEIPASQESTDVDPTSPGPEPG